MTQDAAWRHGVLLPLKARADEALAAVGCVEHTIVIRRAGLDVSWYEGDLWYQDLLESQVRGDGPAGKAAEALPSDHPLFVIHLANRHGHSTDVVHGTGGFLTYVSTLHRRGLTLSPDDVYWCAVEIAWAGQTHGVYGPLLCGATTVMFEGMLDTPNHTRTWEIIERYQVNALVTTPSVVRNLRKWVDGVPGAAALDSLRLVVTFGERMGPPDRDWLVKEVARGRAVVADGWGQFELGGITTLTPPPQGPDSLPDLGLEIVGGDGAPVTGGTPGDLVVRNPWPGTFVTMEGHGRAAAECWEAHPGVYTTGDTAYQDRDGTLLVLGRKDPIISVSGQLVSLAEVADVLREYPFVGETEVLRIEKGNAPVMVACVVLEPGLSPGEELSRELMGHVHDTIGGLARPSAIVFVESFPPELGLEARREALTRLCASAPVDLLTVSTAQLLVAAAGLM